MPQSPPPGRVPDFDFQVKAGGAEASTSRANPTTLPIGDRDDVTGGRPRNLLMPVFGRARYSTFETPLGRELFKISFASDGRPFFESDGRTASGSIRSLAIFPQKCFRISVRGEGQVLKWK